MRSSLTLTLYFRNPQSAVRNLQTAIDKIHNPQSAIRNPQFILICESEKNNGPLFP